MVLNSRGITVKQWKQRRKGPLPQLIGKKCFDLRIANYAAQTAVFLLHEAMVFPPRDDFAKAKAREAEYCLRVALEFLQIYKKLKRGEKVHGR